VLLGGHEFLEVLRAKQDVRPDQGAKQDDLAAQKDLIDGLTAMGMKMVVNEKYRLPSLNTVYVPDGVDEGAIRKKLLVEHGIEIGAGLGVFKGKIWRIGTMGTNATHACVVQFLGALKDVLSR
jgi:alanine-glyoxylate transaminase/serine-glyoxylate transaminase/serine-pyruvate transaminase